MKEALKTARLILLVVVIVGPSWARKKQEPNAELCAIKTVYVEGNSDSARVVRRELEKRTWLKLENDEAKAEAIFAVAETRTQQSGSLTGENISVSGEIKSGSKLLWSDSVQSAVKPLVSNAGDGAKTLLAHLARGGACGK